MEQKRIRIDQSSRYRSTYSLLISSLEPIHIILCLKAVLQ